LLNPSDFGIVTRKRIDHCPEVLGSPRLKTRMGREQDV
jgi:hypothetical protein